MNKIPVKDWSECPLHHKFDWCKKKPSIRCPNKETGERPKECPLPIVIELEEALEGK